MKKSVIIDKTANEEIKEELKKLGYKLVQTVELKSFKTSLGTHPDIQVCKVGEYLVVDPRTYDYYKNHLINSEIKVIKGSTEVTNYYPDNIAYNMAVLDSFAVHNYKYTDPVLKTLVEDLELTKVDVRQGYSKCSILHTKNTIVTSDTGIINKLPKEINNLELSPGHIALRGFDYGFIGGASGYDEGVVYFIGDISSHPDYDKIKVYLESENVDIMTLGTSELTDLGSLIFI